MLLVEQVAHHSLPQKTLGRPTSSVMTTEKWPVKQILCFHLCFVVSVNQATGMYNKNTVVPGPNPR